MYCPLSSDLLSIVGICNQLKDVTNGSPFETTMDWIYLTIAIIPTAWQSFGILPVLNILLAELFPTDIRNISVGIVMAVTYIATYCTLMAYPIISSADAFHWLMYVYGVISLFMTVWAIFTVEETDSMSLVEIEKLFRRVRQMSGDGLRLVQQKSGEGFRRAQIGFRKLSLHSNAEEETRTYKDSSVKSPELAESAPLMDSSN